MAIAYSGLTQWVDESRLDFFMDAVASNDVLPFARKYGDVITGVKADSIKLPNLTTSITIADGTACFTNIDGNNDSTISQTTINLKKGLVRDQICVHGLEDYYTAQGLAAGQHYTGLGALEAGIFTDVARQTGKAIGNEMWNGGSNWITSGWIDQLYAATGIETGGSTTPTAGGSAGTDPEGVFNIVELLVNAARADVDFGSDVSAGNVVIVMSPKEYSFYFQNYRKLFGDNLITPGLQFLADGSMAPVYHPGSRVEIVQQNFLTGTGTVILTRKKNFVVALDLESDLGAMKMGMDQYEEFIWWKFRFKAGVGIRDISANSVLYYGPAS